MQAGLELYLLILISKLIFQIRIHQKKILFEHLNFESTKANSNYFVIYSILLLFFCGLHNFSSFNMYYRKEKQKNKQTKKKCTNRFFKLAINFGIVTSSRSTKSRTPTSCCDDIILYSMEFLMIRWIYI